MSVNCTGCQVREVREPLSCVYKSFLLFLVWLVLTTSTRDERSKAEKLLLFPPTCCTNFSRLFYLVNANVVFCYCCCYGWQRMVGGHKVVVVNRKWWWKSQWATLRRRKIENLKTLMAGFFLNFSLIVLSLSLFFFFAKSLVG